MVWSDVTKRQFINSSILEIMKAQAQEQITNDGISREHRLLCSQAAQHQVGVALLNKLHGGHTGEQLVASLENICPDFATMTIEWAFAGVMARPGLDLLTRQLLLIASCTTLGHATPQLRAHIEAALTIGATREQITETILQMLFYAGGAATSNALRIAAEVFAAT